jgi:transcriptional regulator with XRE-family HTH domain
MPLDLALLSRKLKAYRDQFEASFEQVAAATGIPADRLTALESGAEAPTGDEILIIADYYKCDYNYFLSGDEPAVFEQTEELYRTHGDQFSPEDRWAVQEFLYLCECEQFLWQALERSPLISFSFRKTGSHYKRQGADASATCSRTSVRSGSTSSVGGWATPRSPAYACVTLRRVTVFSSTTTKTCSANASRPPTRAGMPSSMMIRA